MDYDIRPYQPGDEGAILETFNLVFGEGKLAERKRCTIIERLEQLTD